MRSISSESRTVRNCWPICNFAPSGPPRRTALAPSVTLAAAMGITLAAFLTAPPAGSQVITIDTSGKATATANGPVDHQFQQIQPTNVALSNEPLGTRDRLALVRVMQAEQGFAMRPLPAGHRGLTLQANGKLEPAGEAYLNMATSDGVSVKPGGRVVITDIKIDHNKLVLDLNDGPDAKHRFLRHISIGAGDPGYGGDTPVVADTGTPGGARVTLAFKDRIPDLTGDQVKKLLAPLISFDVKTPVQAYTDTLPKPLKEAILEHQVLVGMNIDMVLFAKGQPEEKYHEMDGQMPVDIWIFGKPPDDVTFVRINGNRVIRVELAKVGQPVQVFDRDVVAAMMTAAGQPTVAQSENVRVIQEGDAARNPDTQAPAAPPSLRNPGETLPADQNNNGDVMKPVHFPKQQPDTQGSNPYPNGQTQGSTGSTQPASGSSTAGQTTSGQNTQPATGSTSSKPASSTTGTQSTQPANQPTTVGSNPDDQQN